MAVGVVERLEVIGIDHEHRQRTTIAAGSSDLSRELREEVPSARQAGEVVVGCLVPHLGKQSHVLDGDSNVASECGDEWSNFLWDADGIAPESDRDDPKDGIARSSKELDEEVASWLRLLMTDEPAGIRTVPLRPVKPGAANATQKSSSSMPEVRTRPPPPSPAPPGSARDPGKAHHGEPLQQHASARRR